MEYDYNANNELIKYLVSELISARVAQTRSDMEAKLHDKEKDYQLLSEKYRALDSIHAQTVNQLANYRIKDQHND